VGDVTSDQLGSGGITALPNGNFVIVSPNDDEGGIVDAGSVRLVDGATGVQIGAAIVGDTAGDQFGARVAGLTNSNFVIVLPKDDVGGVVDAGSVRLVDGTTGAQIGAAVTGDVTNDLDNAGVGARPNGNFVIATPSVDVGGIVDAGSVRLVDGATGAQIGAVISGDSATDRLGLGGFATLSNGDFVVISPFDNVGGARRRRLGAAGKWCDRRADRCRDRGRRANDRLGSGGVIALTNGNFVIASARRRRGRHRRRRLGTASQRRDRRADRCGDRGGRGERPDRLLRHSALERQLRDRRCRRRRGRHRRRRLGAAGERRHRRANRCRDRG
jgi:hypothetical protein